MHEENITTKKENVLNNIGSFLEELYSKVSFFKEEVVDENQEFVNNISKAHEEWRNAEKFFDNVSDPDLVDHAIFKVEAAKCKYIYLLKKAKEEGVKVNFN